MKPRMTPVALMNGYLVGLLVGRNLHTLGQWVDWVPVAVVLVGVVYEWLRIRHRHARKRGR